MRCIRFTIHFSHFLAAKGQPVANIVTVSVYQHGLGHWFVGIASVLFRLPLSENAHSPICCPGSVLRHKTCLGILNIFCKGKINLGHCSFNNFLLFAFGTPFSSNSIAWDVASSRNSRFKFKKFHQANCAYMKCLLGHHPMT